MKLQRRRSRGRRRFLEESAMISAPTSYTSGYDPETGIWVSQRYFSKEEWFSLPLKFRRRWWRETNYGKQPPSAQLLHEARHNQYCDWGPDLRTLKAAMAATHPDHGGSSAAFIEARSRYVAARRQMRMTGRAS
jgi:hypothetical protein